jgi:ABC-type Zn2+ transport system substrate-binding protein/surface adhesin
MDFEHKQNYKPIEINAKRFKRMVKKYGPEYAAGYYQGLHDLSNKFEGVYYIYRDGKFHFSPGCTRVFSALEKVKTKFDKTLEEIAQIAPPASPNLIETAKQNFAASTPEGDNSGSNLNMIEPI